MTPSAENLFAVAERLDTEPIELLNGGALAARAALSDSAAERDTVADAHGLQQDLLESVWNRAEVAVRNVPPSLSGADLYTAASQAASALYVAAWILDAQQLSIDAIQSLM